MSTPSNFSTRGSYSGSALVSSTIGCEGITLGKIGSLSCGTASFNYTQKENEYMETLYQVTVVAKNKEIILDKESVVAVDQENAKFMVGLYGILADRELTPADVTVIVTAIGQVIVEKESK